MLFLNFSNNAALSALTGIILTYGITSFSENSTSSSGNSHTATAPELQTAWNDFLSSPRFDHCQWGAVAISLKTGETLAEWNADRYFIPASNTKIYTTALALEELGADFQIPTRLYVNGPVDEDGTLHGDLLVVGQGDPSCSTRFTDGDWTTPLEPVAAIIQEAGIRSVKGQLIGDNSYFNTDSQGAGWQWDDLTYWYGAEATALTLNDNQLEFSVSPAHEVGQPVKLDWVSTDPYPWIEIKNLTTTVSEGFSRVWMDREIGSDVWWLQGQINHFGGSRTIWVSPNGAERMYVESLRRLLARKGVPVQNGTKVISHRDRWGIPFNPEEWKPIGQHLSPPLREIIQPLMKRSQNQYAHLLWLQIGAHRANLEGQISPGNSRDRDVNSLAEAAFRDLLTKAGMESDAVLIEEGSGLSRRHLIRPRSTVRLLRWIQTQPYYDDFYHSLPIAGVDGTLSRRMKDTPAAEITRAKTGTLRYAHALSGYTESSSGEPIAFSFMVNSIHGDYAEQEGRESNPRGEIDFLVNSLATWKGCD